MFVWKYTKANCINIVDAAGAIDKKGYIVIMINGKNYFAHRLVFLYMEGYLPENDVDHINRIRNDNRWCNLREVSRSCNMKNINIRKDNASGITGVSWDKRRKKWIARIANNKKEIFIGYFENLSNAVKARFEAEVKYSFQNCNNASTAYKYLKFNGLL